MYFDKVSLEQFIESIKTTLDKEDQLDRQTITKWHTELPLPQRATLHDAGYDFFMPFAAKILPHQSMIIPTGIHWVTDINNKDKVLLCVPRSGLGFKYGMRLSNSVGIIDADFFQSPSGGNIMMKCVNPSDETLILPKHKAFIQGIITQYFTTADEIIPTKDRNGGLGSTDKVK